jgi:hypothetical protein
METEKFNKDINMLMNENGCVLIEYFIKTGRKIRVLYLVRASC